MNSNGVRNAVMFLSVLILVVSAAASAQTGAKKKRPLPQDFGRVIINNYSERASLSPVTFDHWLHRAKFTCRLCHVDIGFAMSAGGTNIRAVDNEKGFYCGACHNGTTAAGGKKVFAACSEKITRQDSSCDRCHSIGSRNVKRDYDFATFTAQFPKERFGNGIDWMKTEELGLIKPADFLDGISIKRPPLKINPDFELTTERKGMPDIIFSHRKHTVWNGCEVCHPEIFVGIKRGMTKYPMVEIINGKYCGVCHMNVAFPLIDCQRCHSKPVS